MTKNKKITIGISLLLLITAAASVLVIYIHDNMYIKYSRLPSGIKQFISTHFPEERPVMSHYDFPGYDVWVGDAFEIEFDIFNKWNEIECCCGKELPSSILSLLPPGITDVIENYYGSMAITKINRSLFRYEIELSDKDIELVFGKNGQLIGVHD